MTSLENFQLLSPGMVYRLNAGFGLRIAGDNANNDGVLGNLEIGYQSQSFFGKFSTETGTSIDLFGETSHVGAYFQLNYHINQSWILGLRGLAGGVSDEKEQRAISDDAQDFGAMTYGALQLSYRLDKNFYLGIRGALEWQIFGKSSGDQGTQASLLSFLNLAYHF